MKNFVLIFSVLFSGVAYGHLITDRSNSENPHDLDHQETSCQFRSINKVFFNIFKADLDNKLASLSESGNLTFESVEPRESFTKPHRVKLMSRFTQGYFGNCPAKRGDELYNLCVNILGEGYRPGGKESKHVYHLLISLADEYVRLTSERFGFQYDEWFSRSTSNCDPRVDSQNNIDLYLSPETWSQPADRWWFNDNIKPILEKMITVYDLYYGEYEPY